jgi:hypothetical protein
LVDTASDRPEPDGSRRAHFAAHCQHCRRKPTAAGRRARQDRGSGAPNRHFRIRDTPWPGHRPAVRRSRFAKNRARYPDTIPWRRGWRNNDHAHADRCAPPEETRVAVLKGNRIEEFDFESADHKQIKGNIYLAKVTRVEPSLQAAFVDFGGNRHGFLAFSEIHPDYYQIPKEDREALLAEEAAHAEEEAALRAAEEDADDGWR